MKRRDFLATCAGSAAAISAAGCSDDESSPLAPPTNESGIPTGKIGTTDVTVSKFAFGSHYMYGSPIKDPVEREYTIRNAYERGVTTFDIYNKVCNQLGFEPGCNVCRDELFKRV